MDQAVDSVFDFHKGTKSSEAFDLSGNDGSNRITIVYRYPWIGFHLFHPERDTFVFLIQFENDGIDVITDLEDLAGICNLLCPGHFRYVDQSFNAWFDLDKGTKGLDADYFTLDCCSIWVFDFYMFPWMWNELFEPQGYLAGFFVKADDFYFYFIANIEHLGRVIDFAPGHICQVQKTINPTQINKGTIGSYIFYFTIKFGINFDPIKQFIAF